MAALKESTRVLQEELRQKSQLLASLVEEVDRMKNQIGQNSRSHTRQFFKEFTSDESSGTEFPQIDENDQDWDPGLSDVDEKDLERKDEIEVVGKPPRKKRPRRSTTKKGICNISKTSEDEAWSPSMVDGEEEPKAKPVKKRKRTGTTLLKKPYKPKKPKAPKKPKEKVKRTWFKTHSCPQCHYKAKSAYHIKRHMVKHTGDKPFPCPHCIFTASRKFHLTRHIQARHEDQRRFKCTQCSYAAKTNDALKNHLVTHSLIKAFMCEWCEHSTKTIGSLRSHCKTCHGLFICGKERVSSVKVNSVSSVKIDSVSSVKVDNVKVESASNDKVDTDGNVEVDTASKVNVESASNVKVDVSSVESAKTSAENTGTIIKGSSSDVVSMINGIGVVEMINNAENCVNVILEGPNSSGSGKVDSVSSLKVDNVSSSKIDSVSNSTSGFYRCTYVGTNKEGLEKHMSLHQSNGTLLCEHCVEYFATMEEIRHHSRIAHDISLPLPPLPAPRRRRIRAPRKSAQSSTTSQSNTEQFNPRSSCAFIDLPLQYTLDYLINEAGTGTHGNDSTSGSNYGTHLTNATNHILTNNSSTRIVNSFTNPLVKGSPVMSPTMLLSHGQQLASSTTTDYYGVHDNLDAIVPSITIGNMFRKSSPAQQVDSSSKLKAYPGLFQ